MRWRLAAASVAVSCTGLAGCVGGRVGDATVVKVGGSATPQYMAVVAENTSAAGTGHLDAVISLDIQGFPMLATRFGGEFDVTRNVSQVTMDFGAMFRSFVPADSPVLAQLGDGKVDVLSIAGDTYMRGDLLASEGSPDQWFRLDLSPAAAGGLGGTNSMTVDAGAYLDLLRGEGGSVSVSGTKTIDGVDTTQYHVEETMADLFARLPADEQTKVRAALTPQAGASPYAVDVFVTADGKIRRLVTTVKLNGGPVTDDSGTEMSFGTRAQLDFTHLGEPIDIQVPTADQIADHAPIDPMKLMAKLGAQFSTDGSSGPSEPTTTQ